MFNLMNKSCPYGNWKSEASIRCPNPEDFHCIKDENDRIGWVCVQPIWVEKGKCAMYNTGARTLDLASCTQSKCPQQDYRSNDIDIEYACKYSYRNSFRPTTTFPSSITNASSETNNNSPMLWIILIVLLVLVVVVASVVAAMVLLYKRRQKSPQNHDIRLEETNVLLRDRAGKSNRAEKQLYSFQQAMRCLDQKRMVVITGVQGSGKTYLAKSLETNLKKNGTETKSVWISNTGDLRNTKASGEFDIYIFDGIFYELQLDERIKETINVLKEYSKSSNNPFLIFTIPSYIWRKHSRCNEFETWLGEVRVDLDNRRKCEKRIILQFLMNRYDVSRELADIICKSESELLDFTSNSIGFPSLISWICKQSSEHEVKKLLRNPLQSMSDEVALLKNDLTLKERGKYLILAYMSLKDGKIDVKNVDKNVFDSLKIKYVPEFVDKDLGKFVERMIGYYLLPDEDCSYVYDSNILKKIVFVSVAKKNALFVQMNCRNEYLKYVIPAELCPDDMDTVYTECFTRVQG